MKPFLLLLSICFSVITQAQTVEITEGIQTHYGYGMPPDKPDSTWFYDSTVIMEKKMHQSWSTNDGIDSQKIVTYKYTFLDLRTKRAQDYYTFSEIATPVTNYIADSTTGDLTFFSDNRCENGKMEILSRLTDTTIGADTYQRYKVRTKIPDEAEIVFHMLCNGKKYPFSFANSFNDKCDCNITRLDIIEIKKNTTYTFLSYQIVAEKLSPEQRNIFKRWRENAITTTLPLMTQKEVMQITSAQFHPKQMKPIDWLKITEFIKSD